jgi:histidyl-tRNA synthetase
MLPDAEILRITSEIFTGLGFDITIKINHRGILDGIFEVCGVPKEKIRTISSAVDKLDKVGRCRNPRSTTFTTNSTPQSPWTEVKREMTEEKGLSEDVADKIGEYVNFKGGKDLLAQLKSNETLASNANAKRGLDDMQLLFDYLEAFDVLDKISLDMSLARGLDYYTGVIYEVITEGSAPPSSGSQEGKTLQKSSKRDKKKASANDADEDRSNDPTVGVGSIAAGGTSLHFSKSIQASRFNL